MFTLSFIHIKVCVNFGMAGHWSYSGISWQNCKFKTIKVFEADENATFGCLINYSTSTYVNSVKLRNSLSRWVSETQNITVRSNFLVKLIVRSPRKRDLINVLQLLNVSPIVCELMQRICPSVFFFYQIANVSSTKFVMHTIWQHQLTFCCVALIFIPNSWNLRFIINRHRLSLMYEVARKSETPSWNLILY